MASGVSPMTDHINFYALGALCYNDFFLYFRSTVDPGVSPMTDLAMNLNDTSLNSLTPVQDSKVKDEN